MALQQAANAFSLSRGGDRAAQQVLARLNQRKGAVERAGNAARQQAGWKGKRCTVWVVLRPGKSNFHGILHSYYEVLPVTWQRSLPKNSSPKHIGNTHVSRNRPGSPRIKHTHTAQQKFGLGSWACIPLQRKTKCAEEPWISPPFYSTHSRHLINLLWLLILL